MESIPPLILVILELASPQIVEIGLRGRGQVVLDELGLILRYVFEVRHHNLLRCNGYFEKPHSSLLRLPLITILIKTAGEVAAGRQQGLLR